MPPRCRPHRCSWTWTPRSTRPSRLIAEAAAKGAKLIAFPETWLPGYPWFIWLDSPAWGMQFIQRYHDNSLVYGSAQAERLAQAAKQHAITVVMGHSEKHGGSLYMGQWIIGADGETVAMRRKLKPTHVERTMFGEGDGSDLAVHDTPLGRVGALCCWEHLQPLSKYAMYAQNEQVHIAAWPSFSLYRGGAYALGAGGEQRRQPHLCGRGPVFRARALRHVSARRWWRCCAATTR